MLISTEHFGSICFPEKVHFTGVTISLYEGCGMDAVSILCRASKPAGARSYQQNFLARGRPAGL